MTDPERRRSKTRFLEIARRARLYPWFALLLLAAQCDPPLQGPNDPFVDVAPGASYGTHQVNVPAASNWVNTGLYLRVGQSARITGTGTWNVEAASPLYGPAGVSAARFQSGCRVGSLVARVGLHYRDNDADSGDDGHRPACIGPSGTITATRDGIVFVGAILGTDLGETYESRKAAAGSLTVTIESTGATVPTLAASAVAGYDFAAVTSGWVEVRGRHVILTLPTATAVLDRATLPAAVERLDRIYEIELQLRGKAPYHGQRIRFFPDATSLGDMLAGNPVRMQPNWVSGTDPNIRIGRAGEPATDVWGYAHELGHDFTFAGGTWTYMLGGGGLEGWPNIFTVYALEQLGITRTPQAPCRDRDAYFATGIYSGAEGSNPLQLRRDPWLTLCMLNEIRAAHGWATYTSFFSAMNTTTNEQIPPAGSYENPTSDAAAWGFVRDRLNQAAGADVTPILRRWKVPLPTP